MKKMLFVLLAAVLVAALFAPVARASPILGPNEEYLLVATTSNCEVSDKVGIVTQSSIGPGLSAYVKLYDHAHTYMWPVKEWVRVLVANGIRSTKWPIVNFASAPNFNLLAD